MSVLLVLFLSFVFLLALYLFRTWQFDQKLPPGPRGLPWIGYGPFLGNRLYEGAARLRGRFGDIISFRIAGRIVVFLNSYPVIRQAFLIQGEPFSKRPDTPLRRLNNPEGLGIVGTDGPLWSEHRRFALRVLKDFGVGKSIMEDFIAEEVHFIKNVFNEAMSKGQYLNPKVILGKAVSNIICGLVFGQRAAYDDAEFEKYLTAANENLQNPARFLPSMILVFLIKLPIIGDVLRKHHWRMKNIGTLHNYVIGKVRQHEASFQPDSEPKDYIEAFLMEKHSNTLKGVQHTYSIGQLNRSVIELFIAGTDTTSTSLAWALLLMAAYPDVQEKVWQEIKQVIGEERMPTMGDRKNMPYTEATVHEVLRYRSIAPFSVPHTVHEDTQLLGYTIPKGAIVFSNHFAVHTDPKLWKNASAFDPTNFLDDRGAFRSSDNMVVFSVGKRSCLGESLAKMEFFLFFVSLLQTFDLQLAPEQAESLPVILNGSEGGGVWAPKEYLLDIRHRSK